MEQFDTQTSPWPGISSLGAALPSLSDGQSRSAAAKGSFASTLLTALCITGCQIFVVCLLAGPLAIDAKYLSFVQWDSGWYSSILDEGYLSSIAPGSTGVSAVNVGFFPGYPMSAKLLQLATGLPTKIALLLAAQLASVGFWIYFLLLCKRWRLSERGMWLTVGTVLAFPTAFYFASGYTESLFSMCLLGLLYWSDDRRKHAWLAAAAHGYVLSATRIVGVSLLVIPLFFAVLAPGGLRALKNPKPWLVALATAGGALSYLLYSQLYFGGWHAPFDAAALPGWGVRANFLGVFDPKMYVLFWPTVQFGLPNSDHMSQLVYPLFLGFMVLVAGADAITTRWRKASRFNTRAVLYVGALALWFTYLGARYHNTGGSIRYMLPVFALLALAIAHFVSHAKTRWPVHVLEIILPMFLIISLLVQAGYIKIFTSGGWIA